MIKTPVVTALNSSTYTPITLGNDHAYGFSVYISDGSSFYYAVDSSGTGEALVPAASSLFWEHYEKKLTTVMYAKAVTGTPNLILNPGNPITKGLL